MQTSIKGFLQKIKSFFTELDKDVFTAAILILVAFGSFGLGRLSKIEGSKAPLRIDQMAASALPIEGVPPAERGSAASPLSQDSARAGGYYVGSKNGSKYHLPWCSGAERIKKENQVIFNSKEEAEKAGYTPAGNCKGI